MPSSPAWQACDQRCSACFLPPSVSISPGFQWESPGAARPLAVALFPDLPDSPGPFKALPFDREDWWKSCQQLSPSPPLPGICDVLDPPQTIPGCTPGAHMKQQQQIMVRKLYKAWHKALGDIPYCSSLVISQADEWVPLCLSEESPLLLSSVTFAHCAGCYTGSRWGCLTQLQPHSWCDGSSLSSLQSAEVVLQGHLRLQGSIFLPQVLVISSVHSSALLTPLLPSVCAWWGSFCLFGCGFTAGSPWNQPSNSFTAWSYVAFSPPPAALPQDILCLSTPFASI